MQNFLSRTLTFLRVAAVRTRDFAVVLYREIRLRLGPAWARLYPRLLPWIEWARKSWKRILVRTVAAGVTAVALLSLAVLARFMYDRKEIVQDLQKERQWLSGQGEKPAKPLIQILASDGTLIGEYLPERESRIPLNACKAQLVWISRATVSSEDRDFYQHGGVSYRGILRAFMNNILSFRLREGGGSITQQLARNIYIDRSTPGLIRKIYETYAAWLIESHLSKDEILCLYLNKIYMGEGRLGAEEASWFYFRKPPTALDPAEAAMIVGLFPSPVRYSPLNNIKFSLRKQEMVLTALERDGHLKPGQKAGLVKLFKARYEVTEESPGKIGLYGASRDFRLNAAPAANDHVRQFLYDNLPEEIVREGGLVVHTTIDPVKQQAALESVRRGVERVRADMIRQSKADPAATERYARRLNGTLISMDARTGELRALVGGYGVVETGSSDRIWKMQRQPGSAIKGFLYAAAIDDGMDSEKDVVDEPVNIDGYQPRNSYGTFLGRMSLRQAVARSSNTVAVRTLHEMGISDFREKLGASLELSYSEARERFPANLSLALGSAEVTPLELARMYSILLNEGSTVRPYLIRKVEDKTGSILWEYVAGGSSRVLSRDSCARSVDLLQSVLDPEDEGTAGWIGKQRKNNSAYLPFPVAGKSGTVQTVQDVKNKFPGLSGVHDAWFVGLVPGEVSVVWIGQDEGAPFPGGGGGTAGSIWAEYANASFKGLKGEFPPFERSTPVDPKGSDPGAIIPLQPVDEKPVPGNP